MVVQRYLAYDQQRPVRIYTVAVARRFGFQVALQDSVLSEDASIHQIQWQQPKRTDGHLDTRRSIGHKARRSRVARCV